MNLTDQLNGILTDIHGVWTESALILGSILLLLFGLVRSNELVIKVVFGLVAIAALWSNTSNSLNGLVMMDSLIITQNTVNFGSLFILVGLLILIIKRKEHVPEFYFFILAMLVGSLFIMKANSLLMIYLSIELVSFTSYILTNFSFKKQGFEAGIKYLLFGAISSAVMLFGLGLIYGSTGAFSISVIGSLPSMELIAEGGMMMLIVGIFFKISIVPAHAWVPATYQSAPADATAFMSIVPKLAGLVLLQRILSMNSFSPAHWIMETTMVLGIATIIIGTLGAFKQTNARRMISFGAIAHSGFLLPFALIDTTTANESFWWYSVVYALMNVGVFYLLHQYEEQKIEAIADYSKSSKSIWLGVSFTALLISLVGLPPFAGFTAKLFLFSTLWEYYLSIQSNTMLWYLIIAVLATLGSLFYYLQIPKNIFLSKEVNIQSINFNLSAKIIATLFSIALLLLFFVPKLVIVMQQLLNNVHE